MRDAHFDLASGVDGASVERANGGSVEAGPTGAAQKAAHDLAQSAAQHPTAPDGTDMHEQLQILVGGELALVGAPPCENVQNGEMGAAGFEPAEALSQQIYSLSRLSTSVHARENANRAGLYGWGSRISSRGRLGDRVAAQSRF